MSSSREEAAVGTDRATLADSKRAAMYCNYCRQLNPQDAVYCSACGRKISISVEKAEKSTETSQSTLPSPNRTIPSINSTGDQKGNQNPRPSDPPSATPSSPNELQVIGGHAWQLERMSDEELGELKASYEKLGAEPSEALQLELRKRVPNPQVSAKISTASPPENVVRPTSTSTAPQPQAANAGAATKYKPVGNTSVPYGSLIFALICFTLLIAFWTFSLVLATTAGSPDGFSKGSPPLIGVIVMAIWARSAWAKIMIAEPNSNPLFRRKHLSFNLKAGGLIAAMVLAAGGYGAHLGFHRASVNEHLAEIRVLGEKAAPLKKQFIDIVRRDTHTTPEYLQWTKDLELALNEYEPLVQQMDSLLTVAERDFKNDSKTAEAFSTMQNVLQKDLEAMRAFRAEVESAKQLEQLPAEERPQFHKEHIEPIQAEEHRIAMEEIEILKNAKAQGIKLPEELYEQAGIK